MVGERGREGVGEVHMLEREAPVPNRVESYAARVTGVVDVYEGAGPARGTVILLHGGFWRAAYDRVHLRPLAAGLAAAGFDVALPEYRRVGDTGGGMPGTLDDIREILRVVPGMLGRGAGEVVVVGHSAGGHLAVLAASDTDEPPARIVSLAGVLDVGAAHRSRLSRHAVADLLGDPEPSDELVASIDPMVLAVPRCEIVLVHGSDDEDVPVSYSERYAERDTASRLEVLPGADHYDVIDPESTAFAAVVRAIGG